MGGPGDKSRVSAVDGALDNAAEIKPVSKEPGGPDPSRLSMPQLAWYGMQVWYGFFIWYSESNTHSKLFLSLLVSSVD